MPAFAAVLDERARWNLIDFIHANADARRLAEAMHHGASVALPTPGFSADCPDGSTVSVERLRGKVLHLALAGPRSTHMEGLGARSETALLVRAADAGAPFLCGTRDPDLVQSFALYRGTAPDRIERTEFLVDASGWLRAMWWPGLAPDWSEPAVLAREIEKIRRAPGEPTRGTARTLTRDRHGKLVWRVCKSRMNASTRSFPSRFATNACKSSRAPNNGEIDWKSMLVCALKRPAMAARAVCRHQ